MRKKTRRFIKYGAQSFLNLRLYCILSAISCLYLNPLFSQSSYPTDYFRSPLDIPLKAAAYFGDVRGNHFHSGLDLRTEQMEGKNVYAVADGYISRIRVSASGFGYALYINHPNGYTTLYGHLQKYNQKIWDYIVAKQYEKESFEIDYFPKPDELPVKKGDIIALSGNSGGSEGPHLHFEVRDTKTEQIINPLLTGFHIADHQSPVIKKLCVFLKEGSEWKEIHEYKTVGSKGKYYLTEPMPVHLWGEIGLGLDACDFDDCSGGPNGFYSVELTDNEKLIFKQEMERFSFSETRYVNASIDYEKKLKNNQVIQRCFLLPNNKMTIFKKEPGRGIISISDTSMHIAELTVKDESGNVATLKLFMQGDPAAEVESMPAAKPSAVFPCNQKNVFQNENVKVEIPQGMLYDTLLFEYSTSPGNGKFLSDIHHLHNIYTPVHSYYSVSIRCRVPEKYFSKALVVSVGEKNIAWAEGGKYENGFVKAEVRSFGNFAVMIDTTGPRITPLNFKPNQNLSGIFSMRVHISDNLSGIKSYRGTIDGQWILMELQGKNSTLNYYFDKPMTKGKHHLKIAVTDNVGNSRSYEMDFTR